MSRDNELLEQENYFKGYEEGINDLKNKPEALEYDRLCYDLLNTRQGIELMRVIDEKYLMAAMAKMGSKSYHDELIYFEGFKEAFRHLKVCSHSHKQRISAELESND